MTKILNKYRLHGWQSIKNVYNKMTEEQRIEFRTLLETTNHAYDIQS